MDLSGVVWLIFLLSTIQPLVQQRVLLSRRIGAIRRLERDRNSRVITLIHRQEAFSFFGLPFARYIDVEDSEDIIRAMSSRIRTSRSTSSSTRPAGSCSPRSRSPEHSRHTRVRSPSWCRTTR